MHLFCACHHDKRGYIYDGEVKHQPIKDAENLKRLHRVLLVDESKPFGGVSAMVATLIQELAFDYLDAPVQRVCSIDAPAMYSPHIENEQLPNPRRIVEKVISMI